MAFPAASVYSPIGPQGGFIAGYDTDARARLVIDYARNPKKFGVNRWAAVTPITKIKGLYPRVLAQDQIRVIFADGRDLLWPDGTPAPVGTANEQNSRIANIAYEAVRYKKDANVGHITRDQSDFDVIKMEQARCASIMMTFRTISMFAAATTAGNYPANHSSTVTAVMSTLGFGSLPLWSQGTINQPNIMLTLNYCRNRILLDTNGMIEDELPKLIINPNLASAMAASQEIRAYQAQQGRSLEVLTGERPAAKGQWMLPNPLYGFEVEVDATPKVTTKISAIATTATDGTATYCLADDTALIGCRPGGLVSEIGSINFSTWHILEMKGGAFKVFMKDGGELDQLTYIRVEDFFTCIVPAPESGFLLTGCQ